MRSTSLLKTFKQMTSCLRRNSNQSGANTFWLPNSSFLFQELREALDPNVYAILNSDAVGILMDLKSKAIVLAIETSPSTAEGLVIRLDQSKAYDNLYAQVCRQVDESSAYCSRMAKPSVRGDIKNLPPLNPAQAHAPLIAAHS